jgi:hypothetical protein
MFLWLAESNNYKIGVNWIRKAQENPFQVRDNLKQGKTRISERDLDGGYHQLADAK